jgi:hypothetical protein
MGLRLLSHMGLPLSSSLSHGSPSPLSHMGLPLVLSLKWVSLSSSVLHGSPSPLSHMGLSLLICLTWVSLSSSLYLSLSPSPTLSHMGLPLLFSICIASCLFLPLCLAGWRVWTGVALFAYLWLQAAKWPGWPYRLYGTLLI